MKPNHILLASLSFAFATSTFAAKGKKGLPAPVVASPATVMAKYDKNGNGVLDDTEKEAIRAALGRDPDLTRYDKNGDGKLDDAELAAISSPAATPAQEASKRKKKK